MNAVKIPNMIRMSCILISLLFGDNFKTYRHPADDHCLHFDTPSESWDEGIPLGNGLMGALVWGDGAPLKISLDRTDLWDLRPVPEFHSKEYSYELMRQWVREGKVDDLRRVYEAPFFRAGPTKIPAGRIELSLGQKPIFKRARLDLNDAVAHLQFNENASIRVITDATETVGLIEIQNAPEIVPRLMNPPFYVETDPDNPKELARSDLRRLGYTPALQSRGDNWMGFLQPGWEDFRFAVVLAWRQAGDNWLGAFSVATTNEGQKPLDIARRRCEDALKKGLEGSLRKHRKWWTSFWNQSSIKLPNSIIERQWYLETYKFGAAARSNTPPISLQGPWTADTGQMPPWKSDYHHDLNTELSYWLCYSGNRLDGGLGFINWLWNTKDNSKAWTRRLFNMPGLNVPLCGDLNSNPIGGYHMYTHSCTCSAWLAHHFYLHWRYSADRDFLRDRAYPYLRDVAVFLESVTEVGPDGKRTLPLSSSPEVRGNRLDAWFHAITNYDLALIRFVFGATAELADELGKTKDAKRWRDLLGQMPDFALDPGDQRLQVAKGASLGANHRHHSHLLAIHPLGLIQWENGPKDQQTTKAAIDEMERLGTSQWCGFSFSWYASLAARARQGVIAEKALETFSTKYCRRNSFQNIFGGKKDWQPFTLEGNLAFPAAVQEMLLQSYSGTIRIFPAIPASWKDVSFNTLRAEGAYLISARRCAGLTQHVEIYSEKGGTCKLEYPFGDAAYEIVGIDKKLAGRSGNELQIIMSPEQNAKLKRIN
ncbi:MAG: glycosyl hydrolase family 95 catalytic domain-containing protein [Planctomycetota bacterium]|jgi:alpha-L-fucosidase 2